MKTAGAPRRPVRRTAVNALRRGAALACSALALAATAAQASTDESLSPCGDASQIQQWIDGMNARRVSASPCASAPNAGALRWEGRLAMSAQDLALNLARRGTLSHVDSLGRALGQRLQEVGYRPLFAAENLAAGQEHFADVLDAWMSSPSHCANLMRADATDVGIACIRSDSTLYHWYWVVQFGRPQSR
jgi:uncharacterized protein YkwD